MAGKKSTSGKLYKLLKRTRSPFQPFSYGPYLPVDGKPGPWLPSVEGKLQRCVNGYHLTAKPGQWLWYFPAGGPPSIYEAEGKDERVYARQINGEHKRVFRSVRLLRKLSREEVKAVTS